MKKVLKIVLRIFIAIICILLLGIAGLLVYYQTIYSKTPLPAAVQVATKINQIARVSDEPVLLPIPKKLRWRTGHFKLLTQFFITAPSQDAEAIKNIIKNRLGAVATTKVSGELHFIKNVNLGPQAYHLSIDPKTISVEYADLPGIFYALTTIKQIAKQSNNLLPCLQIEDKPDMATRGAILDISRGKVPTLETLTGMVDFLSDLKYNHLELYIEGFSFAYPSFKDLWQKTQTPITPEEIRRLDSYCKERFIELVPNQNSLGHMNAWLATDDYQSLAECPKGYKFLGLITMKTTLSPTNPKSLELVTKMSDDLLPNFSSNKFNVDLDEPFELGKNKDHPINDPKEVTRIYLDYAKRLNTYVKSKGKKMLMWGDVISKNPEYASQIPKDITLLEWRYESFQNFEQICKTYHQAGLHYMVCPGTSSWTSFTGRTDNMMKNVENAVQNGIKYGADGMLITDWGDSPHLQYLTVSYAGLAYAAALSWNYTAQSKIDLGPYLSRMVFDDKSNMMGNIVLELGRYCQFEEYPMLSGTTTGWAFRFGIMDKTITDAFFKKFQSAIIDLLPPQEDLKPILTQRFSHPKIYNSKAIIDFVDTLQYQLLQTKLNNTDSALILKEYENAIRMVKLGAMMKQFNNYHLSQTDEQNKQLLTDMKALCSIVIEDHQPLWMDRNKPGGYAQSTEWFTNLQVQIDENLAFIDKNAITKWLIRTKDKVITAAAVLYLK